MYQNPISLTSSASRIQQAHHEEQLQQLPSEMIFEILSLLEDQQVMHTTSLVCHSWKLLSIEVIKQREFQLIDVFIKYLSGNCLPDLISYFKEEIERLRSKGPGFLRWKPGFLRWKEELFIENYDVTLLLEKFYSDLKLYLTELQSNIELKRTIKFEKITDLNDEICELRNLTFSNINKLCSRELINLLCFGYNKIQDGYPHSGNFNPFNDKFHNIIKLIPIHQTFDVNPNTCRDTAIDLKSIEKICSVDYAEELYQKFENKSYAIIALAPVCYGVGDINKVYQYYSKYKSIQYFYNLLTEDTLMKLKNAINQFPQYHYEAHTCTISIIISLLKKNKADLDKIFDVVKEMRDIDKKMQLKLDIFKELFIVGGIDRINRNLSIEDDKNEIIEKICAKLIEDGDYQKAMEATYEIEGNSIKSSCIENICVSLMDKRNYDLAMQFAEKIPLEKIKLRVAGEIIEKSSINDNGLINDSKKEILAENQAIVVDEQSQIMEYISRGELDTAISIINKINLTDVQSDHIGNEIINKLIKLDDTKTLGYVIRKILPCLQNNDLLVSIVNSLFTYLMHDPKIALECAYIHPDNAEREKLFKLILVKLGNTDEEAIQLLDIFKAEESEADADECFENFKMMLEEI